MLREEKRNKFTEEKKSKTGLYFLIGIIVLVLAAGGVFNGTRSLRDKGLINVGAVDYSGQSRVDFNKITPEVNNRDIVLDINTIKEKKTTTFDVQGVNFTLNNGTPFNYLPMLAYVAPNGSLVVATSLCEPCSGTTFHIEGDQLVCNTCGTRWFLADMSGISGGCPQYPPKIMKYTVQGNKLEIKQSDLKQWKPRQV